MVKNLPAVHIPGLGGSPGEGNGYPLQYSFLENSMDRGAWQATAHEVGKNRTWLSTRVHTHTHTHTHKYFKSLFPLLILCVLSHLSCVRLFVTLWTAAHQAPLSMRFCRQEYWHGLLCLPSGDFPDTGIKPASLASPALTGGFFTTSATWEALIL